MKEIESNLQGSGLVIGIVASRFNREITEGLLSACRQELQRLGVIERDITLVYVPGALEIPLALDTLAADDRIDALIALGCVIRGDTYHFEIVATESARGITQVQLNTGVPVANAILTTEDEDQAIARMAIKGTEAAQVAIEMANFLKNATRS